MRKLATIRKIDAIDPIDGAAAIECATVGGWKVVVKKGEYQPGDTAIYCEIDSWIPYELAPFLCKGKEPKEYNGVKGERLRTVRIRGQLSQGLLLKANGDFPEGTDMTEALGIQKWERPIPTQLSGQIKGNFPTVIPKTDQERAQNLVKEIIAAREAGLKFDIEEKLEGSSMTCYIIDGAFGVCSRNFDLKRDEKNTFWATAIAEDIEAKMRAVSETSGNWNFAIQGELIGPGIQGNIYGLSKCEFHVFDVYDITKGKYLSPFNRRCLIERMGLKHVPVLNATVSLQETLGITDIPQLLKFAEGKTVVGTTGCEREGVVFKEVNGGMTFKVISNKYLMNGGE